MILKRNRIGCEERVKNEVSFFIRSFCVYKIMTGAAVMIMTTPAFAMVKSVELRIDADSITDHDAGHAFLPPLEIEDEDEGMMDLKIDTEELRDADPTIPYTVHFELHADDEIFATMSSDEFNLMQKQKMHVIDKKYAIIKEEYLNLFLCY